MPAMLRMLAKTLIIIGYTVTLFDVSAQQIPAHSQGLKEKIISIDLDLHSQQAGLYSIKVDTQNPTKLAVLLPGYPSVVRPVVRNEVIISSRLSGNFLIRARRQLADETIAVLVVDCRSDSGDYCSSDYQASSSRQAHVQKLIDEIRKRNPTIKEVWLVGTSMGTISSSYMPIHQPGAYRGAIHTAAITEPHVQNSYRELINFDYKKSGVPQFFTHRKNDPCVLTTWTGAKKIAEKYDVPLISVSGGSGFQGSACDAFTEHGFRGKGKEVMAAIGKIIKTGKVESLEIE